MSALKPFALSAFCVVVGVALVLGLFSPADVRGTSGEAEEGEEAAQITAQQCRSAWSDSPATWLCTWNSFETNSQNDRCVVSADCRYDCRFNNPTRCSYRPNTVTVTLADVSNLNNCHGTLQVGAC